MPRCRDCKLYDLDAVASATSRRTITFYSIGEALRYQQDRQRFIKREGVG